MFVVRIYNDDLHEKYRRKIVESSIISKNNTMKQMPHFLNLASNRGNFVLKSYTICNLKLCGFIDYTHTHTHIYIYIYIYILTFKVFSIRLLVLILQKLKVASQ